MVEEAPTRMVTRGVARLQCAVASTELSTTSSINSFTSSDITTGTYDQSEFNLNTSDDHVFRTPAPTARLKKHKQAADESVFESSPNKRGRFRTVGRARAATNRRPGNVFARDESDESSLFCLVKSGKNLSAVLDKWIDEYERHPENAMVQLQQFFISCCGCKGTISSVMLQTMEYIEIIKRVTEQFDEDSGEYPLVMPGPQWRKFKQNFSDFIMTLVSKCKSSHIFDQRLMDSVIQLLTGLADSDVRAFRHTSTFAAMKLSSALVDVAIELVSLQEKNLKQIETEKAKLKSQSLNDRFDLLIQKKNELDEKTDDVRQMLAYIFKSVFVHRYRDLVSDVRSICIYELGQWMLVYPEHFLEDSYLKYIGWLLYDKTSDVRLKCLNSLIPLFDSPDMTSKLELFTNKFKDRIVSMVNDKDYEVSTRACQLLTASYRVFPAILTLKDCVPIYELVYCSNRSVAQAAGEFLNTKVFQHQSKAKTSSSSGSRLHENRELLIDLVQFFIEGDCHDHAAYLVDALIDTNPMMKDWAVMVDLLLSGEADRYESELIEVLVCSIRQAATGDTPVARAHQQRKGVAAIKEHRSLNEDRTRLSEILIPQLPSLLQRFIADREKIANLLKIAFQFQLDLYMSARLEKHLDDFVSVLESIVEKHADDEILQSVAELMHYFTTNVATAQHTETHRLKMLDGLALQLRHSVQRYHREQQLDEEDDAALLAAFRKIAAFSVVEDLNNWQLWEPALSIVASAEDRQASRDIYEKAIRILFSLLTWDVNRHIFDQETNKYDLSKRIKKRRDQFMGVVSGIVASGASGVENAYHCLVDVLFFFCDSSDKNLCIHLSASTIENLSFFVVDNVFVADVDSDRTMDQQSQIELMHKRRAILTQYCKLILHGILEMNYASTILRFYSKFYTDFGDILKTFLTKCRELDAFGSATAVSDSLLRSYTDIRQANGDNYVDPNSDDFNLIRDLAKRFSSIFGPDPVKYRDAVAIIHKDGILFALRRKGNRKHAHTENLSYLEILIEFTGKLMRQDKQCVLRYLEKHGAEAVSEEPYILYKASLQERVDDAVGGVRNAGARGRNRGRVRGRGTPSSSVHGDE